MESITNRKLTLRERTKRHRNAHPRDKVSFGEGPVPKTSENEIGTGRTLNIQSSSRVSKSNKNTPKQNARESPRVPANMVKCRKCGSIASARRVRIGDCHTSRYGKGNFGQTYSGGKGRGRLHGI
jgi:hypothetical protein